VTEDELSGKDHRWFPGPLSGILVILKIGENIITGESGYFMLHTSQGDHIIHFFKSNHTTETVFVSI
jgi:hypothetical protein